MEFKTKLSLNGRVLIPAQCRKMLNLQAGESIVIRVEGDEAKLFSSKTAIRHAQEIIANISDRVYAQFFVPPQTFLMH